jgi:hypothetical protein
MGARTFSLFSICENAPVFSQQNRFALLLELRCDVSPAG